MIARGFARDQRRERGCNLLARPHRRTLVDRERRCVVRRWKCAIDRRVQRRIDDDVDGVAILANVVRLRRLRNRDDVRLAHHPGEGRLSGADAMRSCCSADRSGVAVWLRSRRSGLSITTRRKSL